MQSTVSGEENATKTTKEYKFLFDVNQNQNRRQNDFIKSETGGNPYFMKNYKAPEHLKNGVGNRQTSNVVTQSSSFVNSLTNQNQQFMNAQTEIKVNDSLKQETQEAQPMPVQPSKKVISLTPKTENPLPIQETKLAGEIKLNKESKTAAPKKNKDDLDGGEEIKKKKPFLIKLFLGLLIIVFSPVILLFLIIKHMVKRSKFKKWEREGQRGKLLLLSSDISQIDIMEGYEFENYLKTLFFYDGYITSLTTKSKDYGADIIMTDEQTKQKVVVQAKRYNKTVGAKAVQEIVGAIKHYQADYAMVVTNSHFSYQAETLAKENGVRLVDREELIEIYKRVKKKLQLSTTESELVNKFDADIEQRFPYMI